jgi:hypothetical protein
VEGCCIYDFNHRAHNQTESVRYIIKDEPMTHKICTWLHNHPKVDQLYQIQPIALVIKLRFTPLIRRS